MLNALTDSGGADVAYEMVNQRTFPGWGHMLENGATTLWEHWAGSENTYSHNHRQFTRQNNRFARLELKDRLLGERSRSRNGARPPRESPSKLHVGAGARIS